MSELSYISKTSDDLFRPYEYKKGKDELEKMKKQLQKEREEFESYKESFVRNNELEIIKNKKIVKKQLEKMKNNKNKEWYNKKKKKLEEIANSLERKKSNFLKKCNKFNKKQKEEQARLAQFEMRLDYIAKEQMIKDRNLKLVEEKLAREKSELEKTKTELEELVKEHTQQTKTQLNSNNQSEVNFTFLVDKHIPGYRKVYQLKLTSNSQSDNSTLPPFINCKLHDFMFCYNVENDSIGINFDLYSLNLLKTFERAIESFKNEQPTYFGDFNQRITYKHNRLYFNDSNNIWIKVTPQVRKSFERFLDTVLEDMKLMKQYRNITELNEYLKKTTYVVPQIRKELNQRWNYHYNSGMASNEFIKMYEKAKIERGIL